ncbi:uncharacterized protein MYCGRDRAFT_92101 [Zymoseptoria tritici IPO323]|uniref:Ankyrin repeat protein n=1 Tax=Zymoseptoria tritici (strain CBS 115943 / IPO323) TaxID=336722 RepID=F9X6J5_ZYMTI|nr:uncharacterized protein MYCGRDRAFT_92101 [Zymoseptoria tritici IPO323]EGP89184.1 hypothetical protein MYCGRDRAFT_92101 [Zymoseptoria tritici IPO323]
MAAPVEMAESNMPALPARHDDFVTYIAAHKDKPMRELLEPYKQYENEMRKVFAQHPEHPAIRTPNIVPLFGRDQEKDITIRARDLDTETVAEKEAYIMPLKDDQRLPTGSPAVVQSLKEFRNNLNIFTESSLADMDWSNVVAAGSAVVTSLLKVPEKHAGTKRALRQYYHEQLAPASDVDLFLYGLDEEQALEKIKQIEANIRDALLVETTTVRTKNALTIVSQHPVRHIQVVLRMYKSISEILSGFDVDCSCAAYNGHQVYATPRALAAYMTQINTIDLSRRSPSYESRLSKYAHRGFEVYWPHLDRSRVDPTIYERSFGRTEGLARLLILEKLPRSEDRDAYLDQRRAERGRPAINRWRVQRRNLRGNIKDAHEDEVAEWVDAEDVSDYHTFTIPYGPKYHARKIEKLIFTKDILLNAEWNLPKDREVHLHRHPAFFGSVEDVIHDCCGYCPDPKTDEEAEVAQAENKIYVSGQISFLRDNPGRQTIGSFHPLTADDWTEMAYVGNTARLCQSIVDGDVEDVQTWLEQDGNDPNARDFTGRTPLHLAVTSSTPEIVQVLIDNGARLVARLVDGRTALHLAAIRGSVEMVSALLRKSAANEEEEEKKVDARRAARAERPSTELEDLDIDIVNDADEDEDGNIDATTENSMVNIKSPPANSDDKVLNGDDEEESADIYDVNVLAWDTAISPLHLAIINGHLDLVRVLVQDFGADVLLPVKLFHDHDKSARAAILTLVLALRLPSEQADAMSRLLIQLGASSAQADIHQNTALLYSIAEQPALTKVFLDADKVGTGRAINHLAAQSFYSSNLIVQSPLLAAIQAKDSSTALLLLTAGANSDIDFAAYMKAHKTVLEPASDTKTNQTKFRKDVEQPVTSAVECELPELATSLITEYGVDVNTISPAGWAHINQDHWMFGGGKKATSLLDEVEEKIKQLKTWKPDDQKIHAPIPLKDDFEYLEGLQEGTYALWTAQSQIAAAKRGYKSKLTTYKNLTAENDEDAGVPEKQAAVDAMRERFEELRRVLIERGAKTFRELHSEVKESGNQIYRPYEYRPYVEPAFKVNFSLKLPDLTDERQERYIDLFEAAWNGEISAVKQLTLMTWNNKDGETQPPLQVAVKDSRDHSPFSIAIARGHLELAAAIMAIAQAQYMPPDESAKQRFVLDGGAGENDESNDSGSDSSSVELASESIDPNFTVENVGEISLQVKSRVKPLAMMMWRCCNLKEFLPEAAKRSTPRKLFPNTVLSFAVHADDEELLDFLLSLGERYSESQDSEESDTDFFDMLDHDFQETLRLDRPHLLAHLIQRSATGAPIRDLIKRSGVETKEKPKYYQGLSVHGKKRKDWAARPRKTRRDYGAGPIDKDTAPVLQAAYYASIQSVEWLLSDAPARCYSEFAERHPEHVRVKALSQAESGFDGSVQQFLNARVHLAIHCAVLASPTPKSAAVLRYLVKVMPEAIDAKSADGLTPLLIAFRLGRQDAAAILIEAGADQTIRDDEGRNLVHSLLMNSFTSSAHVQRLRTMFDLIDDRLLADMLMERSTAAPGALTPLAQWTQSAIYFAHNWQSFNDDAVRLLLQYSKGIELSIINGEGHTPLHVAVRSKMKSLTKIILEHDPTLLLRENTTGRTPFEMAEDADIAAAVQDVPALPSSRNQIYRRRQITTLSKPICEREAKTFLPGYGVQELSKHEAILRMMREAKARLEEEGRAKRRLVTLNEANEVARRLAARKTNQPIRSDADGTEPESRQGDEVREWLQRAQIEFE